MRSLKTKVGTIIINAAFLQEIKEDNQDLRDLLGAIHDTLSGPQWYRIRPQVLAELLERLVDQLATHFALEECFGYFEDAVDASPWLSSQADVLRTQHDVLYLELCGIVDDAQKPVYGEDDHDHLLHRLATSFTGSIETFTITTNANGNSFCERSTTISGRPTSHTESMDRFFSLVLFGLSFNATSRENGRYVGPHTQDTTNA